MIYDYKKNKVYFQVMVFDGPQSMEDIEVVLCHIQEAVKAQNAQMKEEEKQKKAK